MVENGKWARVYNWKAPWKGGICTYFVAIFEVAWNPLKFGMPILFVLENGRVFFQEGRKIWTKLRENPPPPPPPSLCPSPNIVGFWSLRTKTLCMCVFYANGGGGGVDFQEHVWSLASPLAGKKGKRHFLTQKESACQISVDSEQFEKLQRNRYIRLPSTEPFNYNK